MSILLVLVFLVGLLVVGAVVAGGVALASRSKGDFKRANQVVPGRASSAPASWAGSHDPEARLHRRLRDAMAALRANPAFNSNPVLLDVRVDLEEQAINLDEQLVVVAALPRTHHQEPLARITEAVELIEKAVTDLASQSARDAAPRLQKVLAEITQRSSLVDQIRAELDGMGRPVAQPADGRAAAAPVEQAGSTNPGGGAQAAPSASPSDGSGATGQAGSSF